MDGPAALLSQLRRAQGLDWRDICPVVAAGAWRAVDGQCLCPIALGSALCDFAGLPDLALKDAALQVGPVNQPILLLPFLSGLAALRGCAVRIDWPAGAVMVSGEGGIAGDTRALVQAKPGMFALSVSTEPVVAAPNEIAMLQIATQTLRDLNALAMRTTVPPSEQSRADAGAGTNDND